MTKEKYSSLSDLIADEQSTESVAEAMQIYETPKGTKYAKAKQGDYEYMWVPKEIVDDSKS